MIGGADDEIPARACDYALSVRYRTTASLITGLVALTAAVATTSATHGRAGAASKDAPATTTRAAHPTSTSTTAPPAARPHLALLCHSTSPLVGIVGARPGTQHPPTPTLYVTHNFSSYAPVSMPNPPTVSSPVVWGSCSTGFMTPTVGWATRSIPGAGSYLYDTTDGGQDWSIVRALGHGGNSPWAWVEFVNPTDGWLAAGDIGSNGGQLFQRTQDGGRTWETLPAAYTLGEPVFLSATRGFASGIPLRETRNGGETWTTLKVPVPATGTPIVDSPLLSGTRGVLPIFVARTAPSELTQYKQVPVTIAFDTTSNGGRSWRPGPTVRATALTGLDGVHAIAAGAVTGGTAAAAAVSPSNWWLLMLGRTGRIRVEVTADAGSHWTKRAGTGLPVIDVASYLSHAQATPIHMTALTTHIAFATVETTSGTVTYMTTDEGTRWSPLTSLTF